jgi:hypothetical protein
MIAPDADHAAYFTLSRSPSRTTARGCFAMASSKSLTEIRALARSHTRTAVSVLIRVMRSKDATPAARVSAANALLDRGWGKATQPLESSEDGALELIHRIERVIVNPDHVHLENSDRQDL